MANIKDGANYAPSAGKAAPVCDDGDFRFAAAYFDHGHIFGQVTGLIEAGGTLCSFYEPDPEKRALFAKQFPQAAPVDTFDALLQDKSLQLIAAAAVPNKRAGIGRQVLESGKDYFTDKSPFTTLEQLETIRGVVKQTSQRYFTYFSERVHNEAAWHATGLINDGAIGQVLQVLNLAPHRLSKSNRPDWFFDKNAYGGIITDIGSHQVEQFLAYSGANSAKVQFARVANTSNPDKPGLEDFGELALLGANGASFYARVDWFTPEGSPVWGDGRTFLVGTKGTMELRKYTDPTVQTPASVIFMTDQNGENRIDCTGKVGYPFFGMLIRDVLDRTETAMSQEHIFLAAELSMQAQLVADSTQRV